MKTGTKCSKEKEKHAPKSSSLDFLIFQNLPHFEPQLSENGYQYTKTFIRMKQVKINSPKYGIRSLIQLLI